MERIPISAKTLGDLLRSSPQARYDNAKKPHHACAEQNCQQRIQQGFYRCDAHTRDLLARLSVERHNATPRNVVEKVYGQ